jgi:hypothetical protein
LQKNQIDLNLTKKLHQEKADRIVFKKDKLSESGEFLAEQNAGEVAYLFDS